MPEVSTTDRRMPAFSAISETCPSGEDMPAFFCRFGGGWFAGLRGSPARPGTGRQAARPGRTLGCHRDPPSGAGGAALNKRRKFEPRRYASVLSELMADVAVRPDA